MSKIDFTDVDLAFSGVEAPKIPQPISTSIPEISRSGEIEKLQLEILYLRNELETAKATINSMQQQNIQSHGIFSEMAKVKAASLDVVGNYSRALSKIENLEKETLAQSKEIREQISSIKKLQHENETLRNINGKFVEQKNLEIGTRNPFVPTSTLQLSVPSTSSLVAKTVLFSSPKINSSCLKQSINDWGEKVKPKMPLSVNAIQTLRNRSGRIAESEDLIVDLKSLNFHKMDGYAEFAIILKSKSSALKNLEISTEPGLKKFLAISFSNIKDDPLLPGESREICGKLKMNCPYGEAPVLCISADAVAVNPKPQTLNSLFSARELVTGPAQRFAFYFSIPILFMQFFSASNLQDVGEMLENRRKFSVVVQKRTIDASFDYGPSFKKIPGFDLNPFSVTLAGVYENTAAIVRIEMGMDARIFGLAKISAWVNPENTLLANSLAHSFANIIAQP